MDEDNLDSNANKPTLTQAEIDAAVQSKVDEALKDIKAKLDSAYAARDEAVKDATKLKEQEKNARMEALRAEGKHTEAAAIKIAGLEEQLAIAEAKILKFARDAVVRDAMASLEFRNERAQAAATRDVLDELILDDEGTWKHKTGVSIKDYVVAFAKDEENAFLFKPKANGGTGGTSPNGKPSTKGKKLSEMTSMEAIQAAANGELSRKF